MTASYAWCQGHTCRQPIWLSCKIHGACLCLASVQKRSCWISKSHGGISFLLYLCWSSRSLRHQYNFLFSFGEIRFCSFWCLGMNIQNLHLMCYGVHVNEILYRIGLGTLYIYSLMIHWCYLLNHQVHYHYWFYYHWNSSSSIIFSSSKNKTVQASCHWLYS